MTVFECNAIKVVSPHLLACFLLPATEKQLKLYNLQKDVISTQAINKDAALCKMASMKKSCEIQGGGQEMAVMVSQ